MHWTWLLWILAMLSQSKACITKLSCVNRRENKAWLKLTQPFLVGDFSQPLIFQRSMTFRSCLFPFPRKKEAHNLCTLRLSYSQSLFTTETVTWRHAPGNRSSPRVATGKWPLKNQKLTTGLKNKMWTNPQIKNHEKNYELTLTRP
jgi:hypothetical protein